MGQNWQEPRFTSGLQTPASEGPQEYAIEGSDWSEEESEDEIEIHQSEGSELVSRIVTYLPCQQITLTYSLMNSRSSTPDSLNR